MGTWAAQLILENYYECELLVFGMTVLPAIFELHRSDC